MTLIELAPPVAVTAGDVPAVATRPPASPAASSVPAKVKATGSWWGHVVLTIVSFLSLAPVAWMYLTSFRPQDSTFGDPIFSTLSVQSYRTVFGQMDVPTLLWHTLVMASCIALGQLVTSLLAAYAFARWEFRGRSVLFLAFIASWLVPFQVTMLPNYVLLSQLGLLNSLGGIIIPQLSSAYAVILLRQHLKSFPTELLDAAQVDGRSSWATLWRVVVPNLAPSIAALGILLFISAWNEYFWPFFVFRDASTSVLQLGIQPFLNSDSLNYGAVMAASGLACLPILAVYIIFQRRVVNAFVRSGLK